MNKTSIINISICSAVIGLILGTVTNIPYTGIIALFSIFLACAPIVMVYLIMAGKLELTNIKDSILQGALCGFVSNITFTFGYCIMNLILFYFIKYTNNSILTSIITNAPFWMILLCALFIGILTATTNAFTGLGTYYLINFIRDRYEQKHYGENTWQNLNQK